MKYHNLSKLSLFRRLQHPKSANLYTAVFPKPLNTLVTLSIELNIKIPKSWWLWDIFMFSSMFSVTRVSYVCGRFVSIQLISSIKVFKLFHKRSPREFQTERAHKRHISKNLQQTSIPKLKQKTKKNYNNVYNLPTSKETFIPKTSREILSTYWKRHTLKRVSIEKSIIPFRKEKSFRN